VARVAAMFLDGLELWDGHRAVGPSRLEWDGDRITSVVPATVPSRPGLSVIPGLVDTHVHLVGHAGRGNEDFLTWPLTTTRDEQVLHGVAHAQRAMRRGVTTVRDLAGDEAQIAIRRVFEAGVLPGPRVVVHAVVGMTAGHNDLFVPPAVAAPRKPTADGPDACRALVRTWARAGADGIKLTTSGGVLSVGDRSSWRNYTRAEIDAVVDEAHALSMPVAAHAHSVEGIQVALEAGVDSIEHATLITPDQADAVAAAGTTVAPTLLINEAIAEGRVPVTGEAMEKAAELVARRDDGFRYAARAGVRFVLGTDANGHHVDFGDQMAELVRMHQVFGYDAERCLRVSTSEAAGVVGLGDRVGTVGAGYGADFLVVRGRPWLDVADLRVEGIVAVVSRGNLVAGSLPTG
jgi:imidazolonepropionase-like amidohydrolase